MKENKYDDPIFFKQYSQMGRSISGLEGAGEWHEFKKLLPDFTNKSVLDLGCGFGWHCIYAAEHGAKSVIGIDLSERMLNEAKKRTKSPVVHYSQQAIEEIDFLPASFDVVLSSLALHYIASFADICKKVNNYLVPGGEFVFSVEHPVFTAEGTQDWYYGADGSKLHWPVDRYFKEGIRKSIFLEEEVTKYHKTLTTYLNTLLNSGFEILQVVEPLPAPELLEKSSEMQEELRRPMMLLIAARKGM